MLFGGSDPSCTHTVKWGEGQRPSTSPAAVHGADSWLQTGLTVSPNSRIVMTPVLSFFALCVREPPPPHLPMTL